MCYGDYRLEVLLKQFLDSCGFQVVDYVTTTVGKVPGSAFVKLSPTTSLIWCRTLGFSLAYNNVIIPIDNTVQIELLIDAYTKKKGVVKKPSRFKRLLEELVHEFKSNPKYWQERTLSVWQRKEIQKVLHRKIRPGLQRPPRPPQASDEGV